jgi:hypothetical protein
MRAPRAFSALRIQFFELSRVGRGFAYGDSIQATALGTVGTAVMRRAGVGATSEILTSAPVRWRSRCIAGRVPRSFFELKDGESTVTSSEAVSTMVIKSVGLLRFKGDQDVSNPAGSNGGDHTAALAEFGVGRTGPSTTIKPLPHEGQTFAALRAPTVSFAIEIDSGVASSFSSKRQSASFS